MLGMAARSMGYRVAVLDPDPECPAAGIADVVIVGGYDDVEAALRLADASDVVTYELEHVAAAVVEAVEGRVPVRPGRGPLLVTQDRLAERRFVEGAGIRVAPWREVRSVAEARAAADALSLPLRLKRRSAGTTGGARSASRPLTSSTTYGIGSASSGAPSSWPSASSSSRWSCP